ncbi:MAG: GNAT family N-acetyltransferase [Planctomycetaceae bacterium]|nr:GNAT family N-acetyltransferase [Planctomycetaceae bacterium]
MHIHLETPRLVIRQFTPDDAPQLWELDNDPAVLEFIGSRLGVTVDTYRERIATVYAAHYARHRALGVWAVIERDSGNFLGWVCLRPAMDYRFARECGFQENEAELGYRLRKEAWGKGYATEASRALIARGWEQESIAAVVAAAHIDNRRSRRVMEKCGLTLVKEFPIPGYEFLEVAYRLPRESAR